MLLWFSMQLIVYKFQALEVLTGGNSSFDTIYMARAAASVGVDGFFLWNTYWPKNSKSDGPNMLHIEQLYKTMDEIFAIKEALGNQSFFS